MLQNVVQDDVQFSAMLFPLLFREAHGHNTNGFMQWNVSLFVVAPVAFNELRSLAAVSCTLLCSASAVGTKLDAQYA